MIHRKVFTLTDMFILITCPKLWNSVYSLLVSCSSHVSTSFSPRVMRIGLKWPNNIVGLLVYRYASRHCFLV